MLINSVQGHNFSRKAKGTHLESVRVKRTPSFGLKFRNNNDKFSMIEDIASSYIDAAAKNVKAKSDIAVKNPIKMAEKNCNKYCLIDLLNL